MKDTAPLTGIRVVEFGQLIGAPNAGMILADLGADVIKVERLSGDAGRELQTAAFADSSTSPTFLAFNRGKRSIALDLNVPDARRIARRLVRTADVVIESFRPRVMGRLGLGPDDVRQINPRVIYASISGFGRHGPARDRGGVDMVIQAESGIMSVTGEADGPPLKVGFTVVDVAAGNVAAQAILAALFRRERTGRGDRVEVSLLEVALHLQAAPLSEYLATAEIPTRCGNSAPMTAPADVLRTQDGYLVVSAYLEHHWRTFCDVVGRPDLVDDPRYATKLSRVANRAGLVLELEKALAARTNDAWLKVLHDSGIVVGEVRDYEQVVGAPQVLAMGSIIEVEQATGGTFRSVRLPARFTDWVQGPASAPPEIGQHTSEVLRECGYGAEEIARLEASSAVGGASETTEAEEHVGKEVYE